MQKKFYAVRVGRVPGIYHTWDECKAQVDGFPKASFKGFTTQEEAKRFIAGTQQQQIAIPVERSSKRPSNPQPLPLAVEQPREDDPNRVIIYTDGSCLKNPDGPGGYAALIKIAESVRELSGAEASTTNNRMEMRAAIEALRLFDKPTDITLHTDSQYLRKGFAEGWVEKWKRTGWITKAGTSVLNQELWQELDRLNSLHNVSWMWVKGHQGNPMNERCDELAVNAAMTIAEEMGLNVKRRSKGARKMT